MFILEQNFKSHYTPYLIEFLNTKKPSYAVYSKVLYILNKHLNINYIDGYLSLLDEPRYQLKAAKIIRNLLKGNQSQLGDLKITKNTILTKYDELFDTTKDLNLKSEILCFKILSGVELNKSLELLSSFTLDTNAKLIFETLSSFDDPMFVKFYKDNWSKLSSLSRYYALYAIDKFQPDLLDQFIFKLYTSKSFGSFIFVIIFN